LTERKFAAHTEVSCSFEVRMQMISGDLMSRTKKQAKALQTFLN